MSFSRGFSDPLLSVFLSVFCAICYKYSLDSCFQQRNTNLNQAHVAGWQMAVFPLGQGDAVDAAGLSPPTAESVTSLVRVEWRGKVRVTVVGPPSIPFGWKVIPATADAASVSLMVNLECLSVDSALDGFVVDPERRAGWNLVSVSITHSRNSFD